MQNLTSALLKHMWQHAESPQELVKIYLRAQRKSPKIQTKTYLNEDHGWHKTQDLLLALSLPKPVPSV